MAFAEPDTAKLCDDNLADVLDGLVDDFEFALELKQIRSEVSICGLAIFI